MHLRKAHYMSGWDWGACLPDGGIFRPVTLLGVEKARLDSVYIRQNHTGGQVLLDLDVDMEEFLDVTPGSVSILGLMNDTDHRVRLLVDSDVLKEEYLGCHPCINTSSLRLKTKDLFNTFLNAVDHNMTEVHL